MKRSMLYYITLLTLSVSWSSCMAPTEEGMITFKGLDGTAAGKTPAPTTGSNNSNVSSVSIVNNQLVINGSDLESITSVRITGPSSFDQTFAIESKSASSIIANGLSNVAFAMNGLFNLILTNANGAATFQVTFTLQDGAVTAAKLASMGASTGQVLRFNGSTWAPSDLSSLTYAGNWNAASNSPNLSGGGNLGEYYIVNNAGSVNLGGGPGTNSWVVGDWVIWNNVLSRWEKIDNATNVTSFNGRSGPVSPQVNDYTWAQVNKATSSINDIADVDTTGLTSGKVLKFDGSNWIAGDDLSSGGAGSVNSTTIDDGSIVDADINATAAIAQSKIANLTTDLAAKRLFPVNSG